VELALDLAVRIPGRVRSAVAMRPNLLDRAKKHLVRRVRRNLKAD
jgi:hypothetical protein